MKYSEANQFPVINWAAFLESDLRDITLKEATAALELSREWVTCACGQQDAEIPRAYNGEPQDHELKILGVDFFSAIEGMYTFHKKYTFVEFADCLGNRLYYLQSYENNRVKAIRILNEIQQRAIQVIHEVRQEELKYCNKY